MLPGEGVAACFYSPRGTCGTGGQSWPGLGFRAPRFAAFPVIKVLPKLPLDPFGRLPFTVWMPSPPPTLTLFARVRVREIPRVGATAGRDLAPTAAPTT